MSIQFKIAMIGPKGVGKSTISNGICNFTPNIIPSEYRPTRGVRILETDQEFNDEQLKIFKERNIKKANIQIWDIGGDKVNENYWPAVKAELTGLILILDAKNLKIDNLLDEWINSFSNQPKFDIDNMICIVYNKENSKSDKQITSNQFPKLNIYETNYDMNNLLPIFHQFIDKLIMKNK